MTNLLLPAAPSHIKAWILRVLDGGPRRRVDAFESVIKMAKSEGFTIVNGVQPLKVALYQLAQEERVIQLQHGWWALTGTRWDGDRWSAEPTHNNAA